MVIMGPSAAGMTGPRRRGGAPAVAENAVYAGAWAPTVPASMQADRASKHTSKPCQQAYKQTVPASIQASMPTSIQANRPTRCKHAHQCPYYQKIRLRRHYTSLPCQQAHKQAVPTSIRALACRFTFQTFKLSNFSNFQTFKFSNFQTFKL